MSDDVKDSEEVQTGTELEKVPDSWFWIRDTKGYGSVTVTLLTIAFVVTTLVYVFSMFEKIGPVSFRQFDVGAASVYFVPLLATYMGRKYTDAKFKPNE